VFDALSFWGCPVIDMRNMGPFQRHRRYGCGLDDYPPTAPRASENFFKVFLGHHTRTKSFNCQNVVPPTVFLELYWAARDILDYERT